jgi:uncharacterized protein (DUF1697 family)
MLINGDILSRMKTYISLLRGINVSGKNRISMTELKQLCESMGLKDVVTYIQSGNVVFDYEEEDPAKIIMLTEEGIKQLFGSDVRVILRDKESLKKILESNPFVNQRKADPERLYVTFLSEVPQKPVLRNLLPKDNGDEFMLYDREVYLFCPNGYGKTKFSNTFFEKKLSVSATTRNWKTVNALNEMAERR